MGYRVCVVSKGDGYLTTLWTLGSTFLGKFDKVIKADSVKDCYNQLTDLSDKKGKFKVVQFWGHGTQGKSYINGEVLNIYDLSLTFSMKPNGYIWYRNCDTFGGTRGQEFAMQNVELFKCSIVGHTRVISWPNPLYQSGGYGLRPGEEPFWDTEDRGGSKKKYANTCSIWTMNPPSEWFLTDDFKMG